MKLLSIKEELHKNYIRSKGRFTIDCNILIFSTEEIAILQKWGHWFNALISDHLKPFTWKQERFIEVMKGEEEAFSLHEHAWYKYIGRKMVEEKYGDSLYANYVPEENGFYSREMIKQQKSMMFGVIVDSHFDSR